MKSPAIALMFGGAKGPKESQEPAAEEASETPAEEQAEGETSGMSDAEAQHHAKVSMHHGKAVAALGRGKHKEAKVHVKLAMHHHAAAMKEAGLNGEEQHSSGGSAHTEPGQSSEGYEMGGDSDE